MWFWRMLHKHKSAYFSAQVSPHKRNVSAIVQRLILNLETLHTIEFPQQNACSAFWAILKLLEKQTNNIKNAFFLCVVVSYSKIQSRYLNKHCSMECSWSQWVCLEKCRFSPWLEHKDLYLLNVKSRDWGLWLFHSRLCKDQECLCLYL